MNKSLIVFQRIAPHYRVVFFKLLHAKLNNNNIEMQFVYGNEDAGAVPKSVAINEEWACFNKNYYFRFLGKEIVFSNPFFINYKQADVIILEQANRLAINYFFLLLKTFFNYKIAYWGHGINHQAVNKAGFLENIKKAITNKVDWFFAYTAQSACIVAKNGFNLQCITDVCNSVDTQELAHAYNQLNNEELKALKLRLGVTTDNVAIYCGGMYDDKKIEFLIESCEKIKQQLPDFEMIFIGEGPDQYLVNEFVKDKPWVHSLGAITGLERVKYFAIAKYLLMPGLVGLAVLDCFSMNTPMITTNIPIHSPEFAYLEHGVNGWVSEFDSKRYADDVVKLMQDKGMQQTLVEGCMASASQYTVENMADNFAQGIIAMLDNK